MICCRQCNSELIEQARFCNVCGLPQDPQETELEHSTRNAEKTLETNMPGNCENCGAEIPNDARFCAICGAAQTSRKPSTSEAIHNEILPTSTKNNNDNSTIQLQPSKSIKPTQTINTANEQESKSSENASIRPKTVSRPPVFPSRPTGNSVKLSTKTPLTSTPIPDSNSETQFASTHSEPIEPGTKRLQQLYQLDRPVARFLAEMKILLFQFRLQKSFLHLLEPLV